MTGFRNVYERDGMFFLGRRHESKRLASDAAESELKIEFKTKLVCVAMDLDDMPRQATAPIDEHKGIVATVADWWPFKASSSI